MGLKDCVDRVFGFFTVQWSHDGISVGIERGIERGISQGVELRNIEIAKNLLDILDDETISLKTDLKISVIKSLRT